MRDALLEIFSIVLEVDVESLSDDSSPDTVKQWDSLAAMRLVVEIEEVFNVELSTKEIMQMASIGNARIALRRKGVDL